MGKMLRISLVMLFLLGWALPAAALEIHIDNSQALGGSLALRYLRADGVWVTRGLGELRPPQQADREPGDLGARVLPACGDGRRRLRGAAG